jgi:GNAT superfamily N-acetyltransferase
VLVTLAQRPDLAEAAYAIPYPPDSPRFMEGSLTSLLVRGRRVARRWPHLVVALLDGGEPVARGIMVPFRSRSPFPARGWDQVAVWAAEDALDGVAPDTACALEIAVHPDHQGRGHSRAVLEAMRDAVASAGLESLVIPVRPPDKALVPAMSMSSYAAQTRSDGLPVDRWLRTHVRAGGTISAVAPCSATVQAPLSDWRRWTGLPFDRVGSLFVPGALAPVLVSSDFAVYVEPNVWVSHRVPGLSR